MPTSKNEKLFLAYSLIFGILAGLCISAILQAIAMPATSGYLLSIQEHQDMTLLASKANNVQTFINLGIGGALAYFILLLPILNPNINLQILKHPKKLLRLGVYICVALLVTVGLGVRLESFFGNMNNSLFMQIIGVTIPIVWWSILGEIGIAGDLSSWKPRHRPDVKTCILLAISTYFIFIVLSLANNWGFMWFFTLVSEVLDGSGEMSAVGFNWLQAGLILLATCTSVALSATIIALAPVKRELNIRTDKLVLPIGLTIGFSLLLCAGYYYGVYNYDLDKTTLATAIGANDHASEPEEVHTAILMGDSITSRPWPTSITTYSMTGDFSLAASEDTIHLLHEYLSNHPQSIHYYTSEDALVKTLFNLWDSDQATIYQQQTQSTLLQRIIFLNRLSCLPITNENRVFLLEYEDEEKWWVGNKAALRLAKAAIHFNQLAKADRWLEVAKERGASPTALSAITIPQHQPLVNGTIKGAINTGRALNIALFRAPDEDIKVQLDTTYLALNLVDSRQIANNSTFNFTGIGPGRYFLALKYTGDIAEIVMQDMHVIELSTSQPVVDIGAITIGE